MCTERNKFEQSVHENLNRSGLFRLRHIVLPRTQCGHRPVHKFL
jgi:hypothetical protein